jgi:hypothetical protein
LYQDKGKGGVFDVGRHRAINGAIWEVPANFSLFNAARNSILPWALLDQLADHSLIFISFDYQIGCLILELYASFPEITSRTS